MHIIKSVAAGSVADELGIEPGDRLIAIDGHEIEDVFDYRYYISSDSYVMLIEKPDGEQWECEIDDDYEDPGLEFDSGLMSEYRHCSNKCIFCFIDQMPPGMRETLYFKDDDARLSFLQGNYVTLTNMKDRDIDRIIQYHMEPINISVHTTDPGLRCRMLHNRRAGESLSIIARLRAADIHMNGQIVLCPGWNDGEQLARTLSDMLEWTPQLESVSVVPIGMTKYREGLTQIDPVDGRVASETIDIVERFQWLAMERVGMHLFHASDEFYILAGRQIPDEEVYDGYIQLENGVGMLRLLLEETADAIEALSSRDGRRAGEEADGKAGTETKADAQEIVSIATGRLAAPTLRDIAGRFMKVAPGKRVQVFEIINDFFGEAITVSGLLTYQDILKQLKDKELGSRLILPINMFRSGEETFLDDMTREQLEEALGVPVQICGSSGYDLIDALNGDDTVGGYRRRAGRYEPDDGEVSVSEAAAQ